MKLLLGSLVAVGLGMATYNRAILPENAWDSAWTRAAQYLPVSLVNPAPEVSNYLLAPIRRGDIATTVTASGALSAITTVLVSSQVSGQMLRIVADYNAEVRRGEVIAQIDPLSFQIALEQAQSELRVAEAAVAIQERIQEKAAADLASAAAATERVRFATERERIVVAEAQRDLERKRTLARGDNVSQVEVSRTHAAFDMAVQNYKSAEADERTKIALTQAAESSRRSAEAQVIHANAIVQQRRAALKAAQTELERTKIRSPVDGVVIGRTIEEGQQVTVTLQTQTLFTVAQDLREMQIKISVDEADIGKIREGQPVIYTVDSFPGREFRAEVKQIRKDSQEKQNVITYVVVANAPNPDRMLMPGMTANARIIIDARTNVHKVPVAALRFTPAGERGPEASHLWTLGEDQRPRPIPVRVGLSDGSMVEIAIAEPVEQVIVGVDQREPSPTIARRIIGSM
ncbi:HlyD family secretion protein [Bradyrhizobium sp. CIR18]|uniref:efflux RND transporter periplasmic adaptor subunit n=1 Tax=Bradyrhizobium sp. CIR18 TaxID=2663839 RepID=UPI0016056CBB|nr:efflux RND transporter periplasmic adaptor subunit [Bradyrhizobium sp. CIR18]MBB4363501.1 HlyD family secretion protein [Bradyrhizobium sp. CIR18]